MGDELSADPRYLATIKHALSSKPGAAARWAALAEVGASDAELEAFIDTEMGYGGTSHEGGLLWEVHRSHAPRVWLAADGKLLVRAQPATVAGAALLELARALFGVRWRAGDVQFRLWEAGDA
jgi:hypothetical protein